MTRHQYTTNIRAELARLNEIIDYKILRGQSYARESQRHKALLARLQRQRKGFLARFFPSFSLGL